MGTKSIYNGKELIEQPDRDKPEIILYGENYLDFVHDKNRYEEQLSKCRTLPCIEGIGFIPGQIYEEGKDYRVIVDQENKEINDSWLPRIVTKTTILAVPIKGNSEEGEVKLRAMEFLHNIGVKDFDLNIIHDGQHIVYMLSDLLTDFQTNSKPTTQ